jgi:hypothetical protein
VIVAVVAVLVLAGAAVAFLVFSGGSDEPPPPVDPPGGTATTPTTPPSTQPEFPTPESAVEAELPADWVFDLVADTPSLKEYWAGPPASEYVSVYIVEPAADGGWTVTDSYPLELGDGVTEADEASFVVQDFLLAIMEDRADDAHDLTVEPFASDPASASFGNGDFTDFWIDSVEAEGDGTYWVYASEVWFGNTDQVAYHVVPTEAGWRIRDAAVQ